MFGMSFPEILIIAIVAVLFLGPEKLPTTMVQVAKFLKSFKRTVNDAKNSFDQEIKIQELKEDAKKYKDSISKTTENIRKKLTFEELDALKDNINNAENFVSDTIGDIEKGIDNVKNPQNLIKDTVFSNQDKKEA
jgi:twin arginine-targeting protein translocase tatB